MVVLSSVLVTAASAQSRYLAGDVVKLKMFRRRAVRWVGVLVTGFQGWVAAAKSRQSCPTLCDPIDGSPPGSPVPLDSPGKSTGVGCHFLLQCVKGKSESEVAQGWEFWLNRKSSGGVSGPANSGDSRRRFRP